MGAREENNALGIDEKIARSFEHGQFDPFILDIEFPSYKNLEPGLRIEFDYPITAIIGQNGLNKSSILRALQACPDGFSISDYWFDTDLDEIDSSNGPQRYIHRYKAPSGHIAEVRKSRVQKTIRGDDYFETTRPVRADGMKAMPLLSEVDKESRSQTRWRPINKEVVYLDFRGMLPAYDILMHFDWRQKVRTPSEKKALVRSQAKRIKRMLDSRTDELVLYGVNRQIGSTVSLSPDEVKEVGLILGKEYSEVNMVQHDLYGCRGWTAILKTDRLKYSEAFAGSGEYAVVSLVREVCKAPDRSLILLDEPETSLHPGAQTALLDFLKRMSLEKKLQIVMSTHSREMVDSLPANARKVLSVNVNTGHVELLSQTVTAAEAFERLGARYASRTILVEDGLAKALLMHWSRVQKNNPLRGYSICSVPGGADGILQRVVPVQAELGSDCLIVLDGDMRPRPSINFNARGVNAKFELGRMGIDKLFIDGGNADNENQELIAAEKTLKWLEKHLTFLPGDGNPENLLLAIVGKEQKSSPKDAKRYWVKNAEEKLGYTQDDSEGVTSEQIFTFQLAALHAAEEKCTEGHSVFMENLTASLGPLLEL